MSGRAYLHVPEYPVLRSPRSRSSPSHNPESSGAPAQWQASPVIPFLRYTGSRSVCPRLFSPPIYNNIRRSVQRSWRPARRHGKRTNRHPKPLSSPSRSTHHSSDLCRYISAHKGGSPIRHPYPPPHNRYTIPRSDNGSPAPIHAGSADRSHASSTVSSPAPL